MKGPGSRARAAALASTPAMRLLAIGIVLATAIVAMLAAGLVGRPGASAATLTAPVVVKRSLSTSAAAVRRSPRSRDRRLFERRGHRSSLDSGLDGLRALPCRGDPDRPVEPGRRHAAPYADLPRVPDPRLSSAEGRHTSHPVPAACRHLSRGRAGRTRARTMGSRCSSRRDCPATPAWESSIPHRRSSRGSSAHPSCCGRCSSWQRPCSALWGLRSSSRRSGRRRSSPNAGGCGSPRSSAHFCRSRRRRRAATRRCDGKPSTTSQHAWAISLRRHSSRGHGRSRGGKARPSQRRSPCWRSRCGRP